MFSLLDITLIRGYKMEQIRKKSLAEKRKKEQVIPEMERYITDLELRDIEKDLAITDLELAILELQTKGE